MPDAVPLREYIERLLPEIPGLGQRELRATLVQLNATRHRIRPADGVQGELNAAIIDFSMGDLFARLGQPDRASELWERSLAAGMPAGLVTVAETPLAHLVNRRRFQWQDHQTPATTPASSS